MGHGAATPAPMNMAMSAMAVNVERRRSVLAAAVRMGRAAAGSL